MYLFLGKIKCIDCGQNYRGKRQHGKKFYIDSGYHNKKSDCPRFAIKEEELLDFVIKHFNYVYRFDFEKEKYEKKFGKFNVTDYVDKIEASGKEKMFKIYYIDKSHNSVFTLRELIL